MIDIWESAEESAGYAVAAIRDHPKRIPLLMGMMALFPLMMGYTARIYRGDPAIPDLSSPREILFDGIRLTLVQLIYSAPIIGAILFITSRQSRLLDLITHADRGLLFSPVGAVFFLLLGVVLLYGLVILISMIGIIRTARSGRIRDGFALSAITGHIRAIGPATYVSAVIFYTVISLLLSLPAGYLIELSPIGHIPAFFIYVVLTIFAARYFTLIYESGLPGRSTS
ncbi:hypothetical protein J2T58_001658 [Methanocalculus alkaliphilus]|uniref:DUF4013 domain-containing protein n=1 Tax=Methanocalculus alkaliphilus TaxID=768730 RepID=UPI00209EE3D7|nr:DUF4013 domain-containing protein [Methanocalculus alkaliphilus]MCP1715787.1 hypothetical protein [Methanocalculus alkaliphilus]